MSCAFIDIIDDKSLIVNYWLFQNVCELQLGLLFQTERIVVLFIFLLNKQNAFQSTKSGDDLKFYKFHTRM